MGILLNFLRACLVFCLTAVAACGLTDTATATAAAGASQAREVSQAKATQERLTQQLDQANRQEQQRLQEAADQAGR